MAVPRLEATKVTLIGSVLGAAVDLVTAEPGGGAWIAVGADAAAPVSG